MTYMELLGIDVSVPNEVNLQDVGYTDVAMVDVCGYVSLECVV
jgi:hypothetical protein